MSASSLGALLIGVGALLLLVDALGPSGLTGTTWGGTLATPERRLGSGFELVGSVFVACGSAFLLFDARDLGILVVLVTIVVAAVLTYIVMAVRLRAHIRLVATTSGEDSPQSLLWCLAHPLWRPPTDD